MKKILLSALVLCLFSVPCFAKGVAPVFGVEESLGDRFVESVVGKGTYQTLSPALTPQMRAEFTDAKLDELRNSILTNLGKASKYELVGYIRLMDPATGLNTADNLDYILHFANNRFLLFRIGVFNDSGTYKINAFAINEAAPASRQSAAAAK